MSRNNLLSEGSRLARSALAAKIEMRAVGELKPRDRNARTHSKKQLRVLASAIKEFGFVNPVLIETDGTLICGHARLAAAKTIGLAEIPAICVTGWSPAQVRAFVIAENRTAELAGWDRKLLAIELKEIADLDLDFDITLTGFDGGEVELLMEEASSAQVTPADEVHLPSDNKPVVSRLGDVWTLGRNRVVCSNAREQASYIALMNGQKAQMVATDPPYGVKIRANVSGKGRVQHEEFVEGSVGFGSEELTNLLNDAIAQLILFSCDGSIHYLCMDWRHCAEMLAAGKQYTGGLKNICVWSKSNAGMGSFYRSQHEFVFVFKNGTAKHINSFELGQWGRHRSNVWVYQGANVVGPSRLKTLALHPTVKPTAMIADMMRDCSRRNGIILDPFLGSGTALIAAEITNRRCYGLELDPKFVDCSIERWQQFTGEQAVHAVTGLTFAQMAAERASGAEARHD